MHYPLTKRQGSRALDLVCRVRVDQLRVDSSAEALHPPHIYLFIFRSVYARVGTAVLPRSRGRLPPAPKRRDVRPVSTYKRPVANAESHHVVTPETALLRVSNGTSLAKWSSQKRVASSSTDDLDADLDAIARERGVHHIRDFRWCHKRARGHARSFLQFLPFGDLRGLRGFP